MTFKFFIQTYLIKCLISFFFQPTHLLIPKFVQVSLVENFCQKQLLFLIMWSVSSNQFKEVIIIGNGPSAILLSFMLDGNWPYYDPIEPHPNEELHCRLTSFLDYELKEGDENDESLGDDKNVNIWNKSLVQSDLAYLCSGLTGRSLNPVSILFDTLQHPDADFGSNLSSTLTWKHHVKKKIDHLVIGQGVPGGAQQRHRRSRRRQDQGGRADGAPACRDVGSPGAAVLIDGIDDAGVPSSLALGTQGPVAGFRHRKSACRGWPPTPILDRAHGAAVTMRTRPARTR